MNKALLDEVLILLTVWAACNIIVDYTRDWQQTCPLSPELVLSGTPPTHIHSLSPASLPDLIRILVPPGEANNDSTPGEGPHMEEEAQWLLQICLCTKAFGLNPDEGWNPHNVIENLAQEEISVQEWVDLLFSSIAEEAQIFWTTAKLNKEGLEHWYDETGYDTDA